MAAADPALPRSLPAHACVSSQDYSKCKKIMIERGELFLRRISLSRSKIAELCHTFIKDGAVSRCPPRAAGAGLGGRLLRPESWLCRSCLAAPEQSLSSCVLLLGLCPMSVMRLLTPHTVG